MSYRQVGRRSMWPPLITEINSRCSLSSFDGQNSTQRCYKSSTAQRCYKSSTAGLPPTQVSSTSIMYWEPQRSHPSGRIFSSQFLKFLIIRKNLSTFSAGGAAGGGAGAAGGPAGGAGAGGD